MRTIRIEKAESNAKSVSKNPRSIGWPPDCNPLRYTRHGACSNLGNYFYLMSDWPDSPFWAKKTPTANFKPGHYRARERVEESLRRVTSLSPSLSLSRSIFPERLFDSNPDSDIDGDSKRHSRRALLVWWIYANTIKSDKVELYT